MILILACVLGAASCTRDRKASDTRRADTLYRVSDDEISSLDPHKVSNVLDTRVLRDLFEGLTDYGPDGAIRPGLAENWRVDASGLIWTFRLRGGLTFSDGSALGARDVVASFQRLFTPATAAPNASLLFAIRNAEAVTTGTLPPTAIGVSAPDARTVVIALRQPFPALPELLAHACAVVLPTDLIARYGDRWTRPEHFTVSGAYQLKRWELHNELNLVANSRYWDAAHVATPYLTYYPISDDQTALRKYRAREVDVLTDFPTDKYPDLVKMLGPAVRAAPYRGSYYYVFNLRKAPFDDVRVRQALTLAVDRDIITRLIVPLRMAPAYSVVPAYLGGYGPAIMPAWIPPTQSQRLARARTLLAAAGYGPDRPLEIDVRFNTDDDHRRVGLALAQMWKGLGVRTTLTNAEASVHFAALRAHNFSIARSGWIADFDSAENFLGIYRRNAGRLNYSGFADAQFDQLYETALNQPDPAKRNAALRLAETQLMDAAPVLPIYFYVSKAIVDPRVQGWQDAPSGMHLSKYLSIRQQARQ